VLTTSPVEDATEVSATGAVGLTDIALPLVAELPADELSLPVALEDVPVEDEESAGEEEPDEEEAGVVADDPPITVMALSEGALVDEPWSAGAAVDPLGAEVLPDELSLPELVELLEDEPPMTVTEEELSDWAWAGSPPRNTMPIVNRTAIRERNKSRCVRAFTPALMTILTCRLPFARAGTPRPGHESHPELGVEYYGNAIVIKNLTPL
jgi:hypothetical protein